MTSARSASLKKIFCPSSLFRLRVIARLLRCRFWKSGPSRRLPVASTSSPVGSILMTRAPQSASWRTAVGPARCAVRSMTRKSFNGNRVIGISPEKAPRSGRVRGDKRWKATIKSHRGAGADVVWDLAGKKLAVAEAGVESAVLDDDLAAKDRHA